jgi:predicted amidohydrolase YtcJ
MRLSHLLTCAFAAVCLASLDARAGEDRTIYYNGKVFTSNERQLWVEGVVVEGKFIVAVGTTQQVLALTEGQTKLVDLEGRTMIPGFNDAHVHPFDTTAFPHAVKLNSALEFLPNPGPSLQEIVSLVQRGAARHPAGTWLIASIGTNVLEDPAANRLILDQAAPNHPVLLASWFGHGTIINTAAMRTVGIGEEPEDPFAGAWERVPGSKVTTGVAREYAEHQLRRYFASQMTDAEFRKLYETFAAGAAQVGYTSIQEFSVGVPQQRHLDLLSKSDIPIRWRAICFPLSLEESCEVPSQLAATRPFATKTASGNKWVVDGTDIERLAFLNEDYNDAPGVRGRLNLPQPVLAAVLRRAITGPIIEAQPLFHTVGDATANTIVDTMSAIANDKQWAQVRPRIEHGTLLRPDRFASARGKGIFVVQNPIHFALVEIATERFSPSLLADIDPMKSLLDAGINVAIGSDAVAAPGNPYLDLFLALIQPTHPSEALTIEQAVIAYTKTAAQAEFQEASKGTIEPGKLADLVVLSQDIFRIPPPQIPATAALLTIVGGKVVHDAGVVAQPQFQD